MLKIKVPATTANMGPGFDCMGMAFKLYNYIWAELSDEKLIVEITGEKPEANGPNEFNIPTDESNLVYKSFCRFYKELGMENYIPGLKIRLETHIPLARGLGSSAACVVGGLMAANELSGKRLSLEQLIRLAAHIEGHPDNSTPSLAGGVVIAAMNGERLDYFKICNDAVKKFGFAVMIPDFPLSTTKARNILPSSYSRSDAVYNASRTGLLVAAFLTGDMNKLVTAMDDKLHQPYRAKLIPGMDDIFGKAREYGAKGVFLSGAGPVLIAVTDGEDQEFICRMSSFLNTLAGGWDIKYIEPDFEGTQMEVL